MCTAQYRARSKTARLREDLARLQRIMGGSSDTELKLLAVTPTRDPSGPTAVTMVTPVANAQGALRNSRPSNSTFSSISRFSPLPEPITLSFGRRPRIPSIRCYRKQAGISAGRAPDESDRSRCGERTRAGGGNPARARCREPGQAGPDPAGRHREGKAG